MKREPAEQIMKDAANFVACKQGRELVDIQDKLSMPRDPSERTVNWYASLLDRACEDFFIYANDDNLIEILQDAKQNGVYIKEYESIPVKRFYTFNVSIRKATLFWSSKTVKVRLYTNFGSVLITKHTKKTNGDIKFSQNLNKIIDAIQATLAEIESLL